MTDTSTAPQFSRPVTKISSIAAKMYANPAYSVHMTRARLEVWRRLSLTAVALLILVVSAESVLSNEAASSPAWCCQSCIAGIWIASHTLQGHRDTIFAAGQGSWPGCRFMCVAGKTCSCVWRAATSERARSAQRSPAQSAVTCATFFPRRAGSPLSALTLIHISYMSREMALVAYRNLLRSARIAFQGTSTLPHSSP